METRDRIFTIGLFAAALVAWIGVALLVLNRDPIADKAWGYGGALLMGLAASITVAPMAWLVVFAGHRRRAYRGDWMRALRRSGWVGLIVAILVGLRVAGAFSLPIGLFVAAMAAVAEVTLSMER
jgi:hypothetical protein